MKQVCNIYSQQKAIRVKRACEKQKMARLAESFHSRSYAQIRRSSTSTQSNSTRNSSPTLRDNSSTPDGRSQLNQATASEVAVASDIHDFAMLNENQTLTADELQTFDRKNDQLYDDMNALTDEVKQLGGKVVEIARLQEIFTEKVLQQEQDLNRLNDTVISSTENIRGGNEQLREAMRQSAGLRVWILFFIITLAFTVLFLDWYNP